MSGELVPRPGVLVRGASRALTTGAGARSTARVSFSGEHLTWQQLPARTRRAARRPSPLVAEAVQQDSTLRAVDGRPVQHATAWRVHEDALVVADVDRPVGPAPSGGLVPVGPWVHRALRVWPATAPPRRRRGVVDVADELASAASRGLGLGAAPPDQAEALEAWTYLPQVVRRDAERLVPTPTMWLGEIVQVRSADGFPTRQDVRSLRMSEQRAVVVVATRSLGPLPGGSIAFHVAEMARVPWVVEQVGLDLGGPGAPTLLGRA